MDIRNDEYETFLDVLSPYLILGITILTIISISIGYFISIRYGILASTSVLCFIGIYTTNSWHNELKNEGYASISNLYTGYFSALFLFFGITPIMHLIIGGLTSFMISLFVAIFYSSIISAVAFRGIDEENRINAIKTYKGPSVVYRKDGPYIKHTEESALSDRKPQND